jgi:nitrate reductase NapE component
MMAQALAWFQHLKLRIVTTASDVIAMAVLGTAVFFIVSTAVVGSVIFVICVRPIRRHLGHSRIRQGRMMSNVCE